ncbi:MAG: MFS transporter [Defluviitaleaceae bacterium]|nr:MFS transporter [Defluviitaleaceae bacterium]
MINNWLSRNPTMAFLKSLRGNPRICVLTEPLWGIPWALYSPFFTLYMFSLGLEDADIGILISVGLFLQVFTSLLGGILTDKLGRRVTTFFADLVSWSIPVSIWAFAQDFRWFLVAAIFNSFWQISGVSWQCLLVEDAPKDKVVQLYNLIYISGLLAVFFAPISGYLIGVHSLVPVMRVLFIITFILMTVKFIILFVYGHETEQGRERLKETKGVPMLTLLMEYRVVLRQILRTPATWRVLILITLLSIQQMTSGNFFALYVTQDLGLPEQFLVVFPILRAGIMLVFFLGVQDRFNRFPQYKIMLTGLGLYICGFVLLIMTPPETIILLVVFTVFDACAAALFLPRRDALVIQNVDPGERARIMSLLTVIMLAVSSPFGIIIGRISGFNRQIPFMICVGLFILMGVIVFMERKGEGNEPQPAEA